MPPASRAVLMAAFLAMAAAPLSHATEVTQEQAKALEAQMRVWIQNTLGPDVRVADRQVQAAAEGDHFRLGLPLRVTRGFKPDTIMLIGSATQISGGRWAIADLQIPSPSNFTIKAAAPNESMSKTGPKEPAPPIPVDYALSIGSQESQGVYDPSFATPSTLTTSFQDLRIVATSALTEQLTTVRHLAGANSIRPSGANRVDLMTDSTMEGYALSAKSGGSQRVEVAAEKVRVNGEVTALSRDRIATMIPALMQIIGSTIPGALKPGSKGPVASSSDDSDVARVLFQALQDLASELTLQETIDGLNVRYGPYNGMASQLRIGMGVKSADGLLQAYIDLGVDNLTLPDQSLGDMAGLLPRNISLHPVLSGIPTQYFMEVLAEMGKVKEAGSPLVYADLFSHGGVIAGLDSFAFDIGGTRVAGMGSVMMVSPPLMTGQAQVTATNFDELVQRVNGVPKLAGALPGLLFAKGVGRTVDNRLAWDITYRDNKLLVNGTDLSAMMGSARR